MHPYPYPSSLFSKALRQSHNRVLPQHQWCNPGGYGWRRRVPKQNTTQPDVSNVYDTLDVFLKYILKIAFDRMFRADLPHPPFIMTPFDILQKRVESYYIWFTAKRYGIYIYIYLDLEGTPPSVRNWCYKRLPYIYTCVWYIIIVIYVNMRHAHTILANAILFHLRSCDMSWKIKFYLWI